MGIMRINFNLIIKTHYTFRNDEVETLPADVWIGEDEEETVGLLNRWFPFRP